MTPSREYMLALCSMRHILRYSKERNRSRGIEPQEFMTYEKVVRGGAMLNVYGLMDFDVRGCKL